MRADSNILIINKPSGVTSHDVVAFVREQKKIKKVGHAGTLDPLAEGVLIVLMGASTKKQGEFLKLDKEYLTTIHLGAVSGTDDTEGQIISQKLENIPSIVDIQKVVRSFVGEIKQLPPAFSAVKIKGQKAYHIARRGGILELKPKKIIIYDIKILKYEWPVLELRLVCSSGTYVRSIARDIGAKLKTGGYLATLVRTRVGPYKIEDAIKLLIKIRKPYG